MSRLHDRRYRSAAAVIIGLLLLCLGGTAFAAGFSDSESIGLPYQEAVEQMADRNVLAGFPDGSFLPEDTLTREQGAKIVTYILLGEGVNALTCDAAPFNDVAADRWSAPCIAWCVERQILLGYGDGNYGPTDVLTGDQFAKMLLCALGLARGGNYAGLGAAWYAAVREDAAAAGLYEGDATLATEKPIDRQQAALLAWNAVNAAAGPGLQPADEQKPADPAPSQPGTGTTDPPVPSPGTGDNGDILLPEVP
ncbi:MAG: S-layer homology domain-containing protein [Firmicutes bacterium]|nr:S-layer homology domain-containing protein [Bacillota bacterium]